MPAACSCGRQVLYRVLLPEPAGKKSESSPSHGPTVALLKTSRPTRRPYTLEMDVSSETRKIHM